MSEVLIPAIKAFIIHDSDGDRLFAKYYDGRVKVQQIEFESMLHKKTKATNAKNEAEVLLLENEVIVFKSGSDCKFFVVGSSDENELILVGVLDTIYETVSTLMRGQVEKKTMLDNLELVLLTIDEVLDHGHILELDSTAVAGRVLMKGSDVTAGVAAGGVSGNAGDLSLSQALNLASAQLFKSLGSGKGGDSGY